MAMAFFGHMGIEWNLLKEPDEALAKLAVWVAEFRSTATGSPSTPACTPTPTIRPCVWTVW